MISRLAWMVLAAGLCEMIGCSRPSIPRSATGIIAAGTVESLTIWNKPVQRPGEVGENSGNSGFAGSRVEVYDQFILVTQPGGSTRLAPHGWYTELMFRRNPQR